MNYISGEARKPSIFVSSTCYDLKQIRQDIRQFIEDDLGYEAILSEYDSFPIDPDRDTVNNCLRVVEQRADIMVLIVGNRYGYITNHGEKSITNLEYIRAKAKGIPIFIFVAQEVIHLLPVWQKNKEMDFSNVVDSNKIFEFVDALRSKDRNWVHEFNIGKEIIDCLKKQLAYLVNDSLCLKRHCYKEGISSKILSYSGRVFELAVEKPEYWEHLLFGEVLKENLNKLDDLRYDMKYGIIFDNVILKEDPVQIINYVQAKNEELMQRSKMLGTVVNEAYQTAMGEPGIPGDAEYIIYVAEKIIEVYKSAHLWALDFKRIIVPKEFEKLMEYESELSKAVIEGIETFIKDYDKQIYDIVYGLKEVSKDETVVFTLTLGAPDVSKVNAELERLHKMFRGEKV